MPTDIENIEEYWDITRPQRLAVIPAAPSESMTVEEVLKAIKKFNKEVLCMGLAIMVNHGDVSSPTIVAESAKEFERLKKGTLVQLTLLTGVPLNILIQCNESRISVRSRDLNDPRASNNLFMPDWTNEVQSIPILPRDQVRSQSRATTCPRCRVHTVISAGQRFCATCRVQDAQALRELQIQTPPRGRRGY
jgi:hypothetical protein